MLIIEFIQKNLNWENLLSNSPYCLKIKRKNNLILFNYSQIESDPSNEIVKEARGTIIEDKSFKPICFGFERFFNIDEPYASSIDWSSAVASSKEDGTLFFLYWYGDSWHVKTRATFDAEEAPLNNANFSNFKELFDYLISFYPEFSYNNLNKKYTYCLEGCSIFNQVVIPYNKPCLFHIMTRDMITLKEIQTEIGIPKPQTYSLSNEQEYRKLVRSMSDEHEGIVVKDAQGNRIKIKTDSYVRLHHIANNGILTLERAIDIIKANETDEFLAYFSQYTNYFDSIRAALSDNSKKLSRIKSEVECWKKEHPEGSKKDFALHIKNSKNNECLAYYFACYENKEQQFINNLSTKKFIKMFKIDKKL